ncbi:MAG TPA: hypothetical protein PKN33_16870 [Phycisphaerae bacterium]|nr:hypothetical protein [Phycisphaerae bacterium]
MSNDESDGVSSYQGYEYQILATVWIGLELMIDRNDCQAILVEPASGEDVAAELQVRSEDAVSNVKLEIDHHTIEVQIKLRQTDQWTLARFRDVVRGNQTITGDKGSRIWPIDQLLANPQGRFALLTNAQVNRGLSPFLVNRLGDDSSGKMIPGEPVTGESEQTARRVAILQQQHPELLKAKIGSLLQKAGVPHSEREKCASKLREEVRERLLRKTDPAWSRDDLAAQLRAFDGLPPKEPGEFFVAPSNFEEMNQRLEIKNALEIIGPPGVGKTLAAKELACLHRQASEPFKVVTERDGLSAIGKCLDEPGRYLFLLEDPWGQFKLSHDADRWVTELPKLLQRATCDKRFLITSRTAIQSTAFGHRIPSELAAVQIVLNEDHYSDANRWNIVEQAMAKAEPWQRDFVTQHRERICRILRAPYSLTLFASRLLRVSNEKEADLEKLIHDSNVEAISSTVADELIELGRESIASAVAIWAWAMARQRLNLDDANNLRRLVREGGFSDPLDVQKLLRFLIEAQWFREQEGTFVGHPAILQGLELVVSGEPGLAEEVLIALLDGLAKQNSGEIAHRIRKSLTGRQLPIPTSVQQAIDSYLLAHLRESTGYDFSQAFSEVAADCRSSEPLATLARILRAKRAEGGFPHYEPWEPPTLSEADIQNIVASPETREFVGKFVREVLSSDEAEPYQAPALQDFFGRLGWELTEDFLIAVESGLARDNMYPEPAVECALSGDDPPFDRIVDAALSHYDATCQWWDESQDSYRAARQAETNADYASHIAEQPQERFAPSEHVLNCAIAIRIRKQGHAWLVAHARRDILLAAWSKSVTPSTPLEELTALAEACKPEQVGLFFDAAEKSKKKEIAPAVMACLLTEQCTAGWHALMTVLSIDELEALASESAGSLPLLRRIELADVVVGRLSDIEDGQQKSNRIINTLLNPSEQDVLNACHLDHVNETKTPTQDTDFVRAALHEIAESAKSESLAARATFRLANCGENVSAYLPRLMHSKDQNICLNCLTLLAHNGDDESRQQLRDALTHEDYHCRRDAMKLLAHEASADEKSAILAMASDRSAPVREACADVIREQKWDDAQPVLLELLKDRRSAQLGIGLFRGQIHNFHVARAAAKALDTFADTVHVSTVQAVKAFLEQRNPKEDDPVVHYYALQFLAGVQTDEVIALLVSCLSDDWHVPGMKHEGFPLRYVAAWGLLAQLQNDSAVAESISTNVIYEATRHHDPRLAGPSLFCLGLCGHRANAPIIELCRVSTFTENRAALLLVALALANSEPPRELLDLLAEHPIRAVVQFAKAHAVDEAAWASYCEENRAVGDWMSSIQSSDDVNPTLRLALYELFNRQIEYQLSRDDVRGDELPKSLPVVNLYSMTGGE